MSQQNVDLVRSLQPPPEADVAAMLRDEATAAGTFEAIAPFFHPDVEVKGPTAVLPADVRYVGLEGLRAGWLEWLAPWESYRVEVQDVIDADDDVVVLVRDFARRAGMTVEASVV